MSWSRKSYPENKFMRGMINQHEMPDGILFLRHVVMPEGGAGCWLWKGAVTSDNKAECKIHSQYTTGARASWILFRKQRLPAGNLTNLCGNKLCVHPWHWEPETARTRFQLKVKIDDVTGCWAWLGSPHFIIDGKYVIPVRASLLLFGSAKQKKLATKRGLRLLCGTPGCIRPGHQKERGPGRAPKAWTECAEGHDLRLRKSYYLRFTTDKNGVRQEYRRCRICHLKGQREAEALRSVSGR